jgi:pilus assembly protein CpaC
MYANCFPPTRRTWPIVAAVLALISCCWAPSAKSQDASQEALQGSGSIVRNISRANERIEMTVNTSQILTLGTRIPRLVVNNPELVKATPISEDQVQIAALKPGVTQINLWDENGQIYTVDLLIFGDVRELELVLKQMYPESSIRVMRLTNSLVLSGQVDRAEIVSTVFRLAEDYAPKVVSNLQVGGVQQVMLKVKVMEVSRTKLRKMGVDFGVFGSSGGFVSSVSDLISASTSSPGSIAGAGGPGGSIDFGVVDGSDGFFAVIDAMQRNGVSKILADPTLTAISGRPASFLVGGEVPIPVPQGNSGQITIEFRKFGTQVDFVPIVLGNGRIRLEVRPVLSELDFSIGVPIGTAVVPGLKSRSVDTGVEMNAGQTLALAGLIQEKIEASHQGLPYLSDIPIVGVPFRKVSEQVNEVESLVLVTPDFVEAMDPHEVPQCGPGMETMSPAHCELYWRGMIEVPACGPCGASDPCTCNAPGLRCENCGQGSGGFAPAGGYPPAGYGQGGFAPAGYGPTGPAVMATDGMQMNGGSMGVPVESGMPTLADPAVPSDPTTGPIMEPIVPGDANPPDPAARRTPPGWQRTANGTSTPGLIGPIGYDVQK